MNASGILVIGGTFLVLTGLSTLCFAMLDHNNITGLLSGGLIILISIPWFVISNSVYHAEQGDRE